MGTQFLSADFYLFFCYLQIKPWNQDCSVNGRGALYFFGQSYMYVCMYVYSKSMLIRLIRDQPCLFIGYAVLLKGTTCMNNQVEQHEWIIRWYYCMYFLFDICSPSAYEVLCVLCYEFLRWTFPYGSHPLCQWICVTRKAREEECCVSMRWLADVRWWYVCSGY